MSLVDNSPELLCISFFYNLESFPKVWLSNRIAKMNVNKKLDRLKQWAGERMGGEVKTNTSDEFKALEMEMTLRHEGMAWKAPSMTSGY